MTTTAPPKQAAPQPVRLNSHDLLQKAKAVQIEHDGKIYELRLTRLNKLILTA
jgi:hemin uptake protein HemP